MKKLTILLFSVFLSYGTYAQYDMPLSMEKTIAKMQLEYLQPVEETPLFIPAGKNRYFEYDFGMELNGGTVILVQTRKDDGNYIPQVMISALVAHLATNDQDVDIRQMQPTNSYLKATNCDWAIESLFVPKKGMGEFKIAYLKSIFKEGVGATNILYLAKEELETSPILKYKY